MGRREAEGDAYNVAVSWGLPKETGSGGAGVSIRKGGHIRDETAYN